MAEMDVMGDKPDEHKAGGRMHKRRAAGGRTEAAPKAKESINEYNASGSPEMKEATDRKPGFKGGGKALKDGGSAEGHMARGRHDRHQRGGSARSPYSTGSKLSPPADDRPGRGIEGGPSA